MNNKGFAVSSVIYGLSILGILIIAILMGTISSTRNNISKEAKAVEEFLLNFNQTEVMYHGDQHNTVFHVPDGQSGWYRVEAFGQGSEEALGAYTTGVMYMKEGESYIININGYKTTFGYGYGSSEILMVAGAGSGSIPGGGIKCYSEPAKDGTINMTTYTLASETYTGIEGIRFYNCIQGSYVVGYPGADYDEGMFEPSHDPVDLTYDNYFFFDGLIVPGASGALDGKVVIRRVAGEDETLATIPRKNHKFDNAHLIEVEYPASPALYSILYSYHEDDDHDGLFTEHVKSCNTRQCVIDPPRDIDEITIMFYEEYYDEFSGTNQITEFVPKIANMVNVMINSETNIIYRGGNLSGVETGITIGRGLHLSAYQPDTFTNDYQAATNNFPDHGNYYIFPITSENKVLSAVSSSTDDANKVKTEHLTGESRQIWSIDKINDVNGSAPNFPNIQNQSGRKEYRIMDLAHYKALNIYYDDNAVMNFVSASETFNTLSRNDPQIWNIYPLADTSCAIRTVVPSVSSSQKSGFLFAKPAGEGPNNVDDVLIGPAINQGSQESSLLPTNIERFILFSLDFSK